MSEEILITLIMLVALLGVIALFLGAADLFTLAAQQGFVGLAAYMACWVFLTPITATFAVILGLHVMWRIICPKI